jgi:hypothetical protein
MVGLDLEGAVVSPQVDRSGNTGDATFIDLYSTCQQLEKMN